MKFWSDQISYGRFNAAENGNCNIDLFVVQNDGKKIVDSNKQKALCSRLRMELSCSLRVNLISRGPDTELIVANPVELSGKGRPLVFFDITLALKILKIRIFLVYLCSFNLITSFQRPPIFLIISYIFWKLPWQNIAVITITCLTSIFGRAISDIFFPLFA